MFSRVSLSMYDGRGDGNAEERRGEERTTIEVLLICLFACLLVCFRVNIVPLPARSSDLSDQSCT
jgi:hypothetical protein